MQISQPPMVQIGKFQCLSNRAFPELFKTHPTLICRSIVQASRSLQTNRPCYLIALVCLNPPTELLNFLETVTYYHLFLILNCPNFKPKPKELQRNINVILSNFSGLLSSHSKNAIKKSASCKYFTCKPLVQYI